MTPALLASKQAAEDAAIVPAWAEAARLIDAGLDAAADHAIAALTKTLRETPDGRKTVAKARRSRSYTAATNRLGEVGGKLLDLIRATRERSYVEAYAHWIAVFPAEFVRPDPTPTLRELSVIRGFAIHGVLPSTEVGAPLSAASRRLLATLAQASRRDNPAADAVDGVRAWKLRTGGALKAMMRTALSDSQVFADTAAAWHVVKPEYREGSSPLGID